MATTLNVNTTYNAQVSELAGKVAKELQATANSMDKMRQFRENHQAVGEKFFDNKDITLLSRNAKLVSGAAMIVAAELQSVAAKAAVSQNLDGNVASALGAGSAGK